MPNLLRHIENAQKIWRAGGRRREYFKDDDTDAEVDLDSALAEQAGAESAHKATHWADGGQGRWMWRTQ